MAPETPPPSLAQAEAWLEQGLPVTLSLNSPVWEGTCPSPTQDPAEKGSQWHKHPKAVWREPGCLGSAPSPPPDNTQEQGCGVKCVGLDLAHPGSMLAMAMPTLRCLPLGDRDQTWHVQVVNRPISW